MNGCKIAFSFCLLCLFLIGEAKLNRKSEGIKSLIAIKDLFLQRRESIYQLEDILIFPVQLASEVYTLYEVRKETAYFDASSLGRAILAETNLTAFLDEYEYDFQVAVGDMYARGYTYICCDPKHPEPDRNLKQDERILLAFKCYLKWRQANPDLEAYHKARLLPPFVTMVALRIHDLQSEQFQWSEWVTYFSSNPMHRPNELKVKVLRSIKTFGYAEFRYGAGENCVAGALRLIVTPHLAIVFVTTVKERDQICRLPEILLKILEDINFETIDFKPQRLFVSVPIIKTAGVVHPAKHLKKLGLYFEIPYMGSISDRYLSMGLVFDPEVRPNSTIPKDIPTNIKRFNVERPFLVAVIQAGNKLPLVLGLIHSPIAQPCI